MKQVAFYKEDNNKNGLRLEVNYDDNGNPTNAVIKLVLATEKPRKRLLGEYNFINKTLYVERKSEKHYHYAMKGYGFNYELLNDSYLGIEWVVAKIDNQTYRIPKNSIIDYGRFLQFSQQGFELQKFVPFAIIKNYKT